MEWRITCGAAPKTKLFKVCLNLLRILFGNFGDVVVIFDGWTGLRFAVFFAVGWIMDDRVHGPDSNNLHDRPEA